jgi:hypothetical protein
MTQTRVRATLERSSVRRGTSADSGQTLLFRNIVDAAAGKIIRNHVWLQAGAWWSTAANEWMTRHNRHMQGVAVEFTVTIEPVIKGYLGDPSSRRALDRPSPRVDELGFSDPADLIVIGPASAA